MYILRFPHLKSPITPPEFLQLEIEGGAFVNLGHYADAFIAQSVTAWPHASAAPVGACSASTSAQIGREM